MSEVADAGGVRVVAVAEHGNIYQVRGRRILPNLGIDAGEVDPFVEPLSDPFVAGVGNEVREAADIFVVSRGFNRLPQITSIARFSPRSVRNRRNSRAG
jgi:hypothetical protein